MRGVKLGLAFLGAFYPHDSGSEEDTGYRESEDGVGSVVVVDGYCGIYPPHDRAHKPDKGQIPHSHRGYLNDTDSQCDNSGAFRYFGNRKRNLGAHPLR